MLHSISSARPRLSTYHRTRVPTLRSTSSSTLSILLISTNGGDLSFGTLAGALSVANATIDGGGTIDVGATVVGLLDSGAFDFSTNGGSLVLGTASDFLNLSFAPTIGGFGAADDLIDDRSLSAAGFENYVVSGAGPTQTITVHDSAGNLTFTTSDTFFNPGTYASETSGPIFFKSDGFGGLEIAAVCFLRGTRIATPDGEMRIEELRVGDLVDTRVGNCIVARPVVWIGWRKVDLTRHDNPRDLWPVRIRAGAFGDGAPCRDLLVTQEHCIFADGKLVPARMLVNGASIILDSGFREFEYFHLELERHSILIADGLEAESYLDTGNRRNFANASITALQPSLTPNESHLRWARDAAAPLATDPADVQPIWSRLADRAALRGLAPKLPAVSGDPALRVVAAGRTIRPISIAADRYVFGLPAGPDSIRLISRAAAPADSRPWLDDRRRLGVAVSRLVQSGGGAPAVLAADDPSLAEGWHAAESGPSGPFRWTDGDARIALRRGTRVLEVRLQASGMYPVMPENFDQTCAAA